MKERCSSLPSFTVIVTFIAVALMGCALLPLLPVKLSPSETLPRLTVSFSMPGNSARAIESEVTSKLESMLSRIKGVKHVNSQSSNGSGSITLDLDRHADMDIVRFEASTIVRQAWGSLPDGVSYPVVAARQVDSKAGKPFMTFNINAPANPVEIMSYAEDYIKPVISRIAGIGKVELNGAMPMEWRLHYDIDRLNALGLAPTDLQKAISDYYGSEFLGMAPQGSDDGQWIRLMRVPGGDASTFDPALITVNSSATSTVFTLDKLVTVQHIEGEPRSYFRINGLNSIYLNLTAEEDANQIKLSAEVLDVMASLEKAMPPGYMVKVSYNATDSISKELDKIYFRSGLTVLILLLFVALITINLRYVLLITIGLTINMAVAVVFYYLAGVEIQLYSLAGITISLNLIIDNLIVMTDHITRRHNLRAFTAVLAATLTTVGALSVVFFMDEKTRLSLQDFVIVVIINLTVSLAVALFLVPALVEQLGIRRRRTGAGSRLRRRIVVWLARVYFRFIGVTRRHRVVLLVILVLAFGLPVYKLPEKIEGDTFLHKTYNATLGSPLYREKIRPVTNMAFGGALRLFTEKVYNGNYYDRKPSEPSISINATLPNGATLDQMNVLIKRMENYLASFDGIRQFQTSVPSPRRASISVLFKPEVQYTSFPYQLKADVINKALTLGGGSWSVSGLEDQGFNNDVREHAGNYRIQMTGYNYDDLSDWARRMCDTLLTHRRIKEVTVNSEFSWYKDDYTEMYLDIDKEALSKTGITVSQLFNAVRPAFGREMMVGTIDAPDGAETIRLYAVQSNEYDVWGLLNRPFKIGNREFKLKDFASVQRRMAPQNIVKKDQEYVLCLQYEYIGSSIQGDRIMEKDINKLNELMPLGYKAQSDRNSWRGGEAAGNYWLLVLVLAIIFFTSAILFNSLIQPLAIILVIPVSFIGVFLTFYMFNIRFDQGGFASFILLCGITVNAAIYIINEYNSLRKRYPLMSRRRAYAKAWNVKVVPVMLTVVSTILGFIPFIVGTGKESFWFPLAVGTMGGLVMSLIAIFIYLPSLVLPREPKRSKTSGK